MAVTIEPSRSSSGMVIANDRLSNSIRLMMSFPMTSTASPVVGGDDNKETARSDVAFLHSELTLCEVCLPSVARPAELGLALDKGDTVVAVPNRNVWPRGTSLLFDCAFALGNEGLSHGC